MTHPADEALPPHDPALLEAFDNYARTLVHKPHRMTPAMWPKGWPFFEAGWNARAALAAAPAAQAEPQAQAGEPVAWVVFALVGDSWVAQYPVRMTQAAAKADCKLYATGTNLEVRPLYAAPPKSAALTDARLRKMWEDGWGAYCSYAAFTAVSRTIERAHGIGAQEG